MGTFLPLKIQIWASAFSLADTEKRFVGGGKRHGADIRQ